MFNADKFRGKIAETRNTIASVAKEMGIAPSTLHRKVDGESDFTRGEIITLIRVLNLTPEDVTAIFFEEKLA